MERKSDEEAKKRQKKGLTKKGVLCSPEIPGGVVIFGM
jgi:hypothetical protein